MSTEEEQAQVRDWLNKAPFDDPKAQAAHPTFSYENWFKEGRALPHSAEILTEVLEQEKLDKPSGNGMRIAYALGWIGGKRKREIDALLRALGSKDGTLRVEAVSALGRLGGASEVPTLEKLLTDEKEDANVRANACLSIGRLGVLASEKLLRDTLEGSNPFLAKCAEEALRLLAASGAKGGK
jgi:HEAT repeat protein